MEEIIFQRNRRILSCNPKTAKALFINGTCETTLYKLLDIKNWIDITTDEHMISVTSNIDNNMRKSDLILSNIDGNTRIYYNKTKRITVKKLMIIPQPEMFLDKSSEIYKETFEWNIFFMYKIDPDLSVLNSAAKTNLIFIGGFGRMHNYNDRKNTLCSEFTKGNVEILSRFKAFYMYEHNGFITKFKTWMEFMNHNNELISKGIKSHLENYHDESLYNYSLCKSEDPHNFKSSKCIYAGAFCDVLPFKQLKIKNFVAIDSNPKSDANDSLTPFTYDATFIPELDREMENIGFSLNKFEGNLRIYNNLTTNKTIKYHTNAYLPNAISDERSLLSQDLIGWNILYVSCYEPPIEIMNYASKEQNLIFIGGYNTDYYDIRCEPGICTKFIHEITEEEKTYTSKFKEFYMLNREGILIKCKSWINFLETVALYNDSDHNENSDDEDD